MEIHEIPHYLRARHLESMWGCGARPLKIGDVVGLGGHNSQMAPFESIVLVSHFPLAPILTKTLSLTSWHNPASLRTDRRTDRISMAIAALDAARYATRISRQYFMLIIQ